MQWERIIYKKFIRQLQVIIRYFSFQKAFADERGVLLMPKSLAGTGDRRVRRTLSNSNGYVGLKFITKKQ
jgi:hypothetical protein